MIGEHDKKAVAAFNAAIEPLWEAYSDPTLSYLAVRTPQGLLLLKGQVSLNNAPTKVKLGNFTSANVFAGHCLLSDLAETFEKFIEVVETGKIQIGKEILLFPPRNNSQHGAYYQPFHEAGLQNHNRVGVLGIVGAQNSEVNRTLHLDWEVKASPTPYDGIAELAAEYQVGALRTDAVAVEVVAFNVAAFDLTSVVSGTKARLGLRLAKNAKPELAALGYRIVSKGQVVRGQLPGKEFEWSEEPDHRQGWAEIEVPHAAVVHAIANYAGIAQHQGWALDRDAVQNPLRASYETFDKGLAFLNEVLARESKSGSTSRDLEMAVSWVLWMLGFSVVTLGTTAKTQDAPDIIATSPAGNQAVVEVTTGLLGADKKLTNLHDRVQAVRRSLAASGSNHIRVLPVMVTSKTRAEVAPELEQAEKWGIYVITKDDFENLLTRTLFLPQADQLFEQAEQAARDAQTRREAQPPTFNLPST